MSAPAIRCVSRSKTGLRVYWETADLDRHRFAYTIEKDNLLLDEIDPNERGGYLVRATRLRLNGTQFSEWQCQPLRGPRYASEGVIEPVGGGNRLAYIIPNIPDLVVKDRYYGLAPDPVAEPSNPDPVSEPARHAQAETRESYMRTILGMIARVEKVSAHQLVKENGVWEWRAPPIRLD
jgi:hypothetical protein